MSNIVFRNEPGLAPALSSTPIFRPSILEITASPEATVATVTRGGDASSQATVFGIFGTLIGVFGLLLAALTLRLMYRSHKIKRLYASE